METAFMDTEFRVTHTFDVFNPPSIKFAKRAAQLLRKAYYTTTGREVKLSTAQEAVARAYGHDDWFTLSRQIDRGGYRQSQLDSELTPQMLTARCNHQRAALEAFLGLFPGDASQITIDAGITSSAKGSVSETPRRPAPANFALPLAGPRPGLSEIFLTAYPFSLAGGGVLLPGWEYYVIVAAPTDNTALWVRFCAQQELVDEAKKLVLAIKDLSGASLALAHVPSQVVAKLPDLAKRLATFGVKVGGGRGATMASQLRRRLNSVLDSMYLNDGEDVPSNEELAAQLHGAAGFVEIPDSKNLHGGYDFRCTDFARDLLRQIRAERWPHATKAPRSVEPAEPVRRTQFWREADGRIKFGSAVQPIAKGTPVYRIRIELSLVDDFSEEERRVTVTRVIDVPVCYDLWDLHVAIQDAMGWADYHLHEFAFYAAPSGNKIVTFCSPNRDDPDEPTSANEKLWDHIPAFAARPARYLYDFGDSWKHKLTLVAAVPSDGGGYPRCISGERACPPEDCGSDSGYFRVLDVLAGGTAAAEHAADVTPKEMREWLKTHVNVSWPYRPDHFDPGNVEFCDPQERWDYAYGDVERDD